MLTTYLTRGNSQVFRLLSTGMCIDMALVTSFTTGVALITNAFYQKDKAKGFWVIGEPVVNISHYYGIVIENNNANHISITKLWTSFSIH